VTDPLAGKRKAINEGKVTVLRYPASKPCPIEVGEKHTLQSCVIEVERVTRKLIKGKEAEWHVTFIRHEEDRPYLLRFTPPAHADRDDRRDADASAIERARVESAYTSTTHAASPHEPESVGPDWEDKHKAERELERQKAREERFNVERQNQEVDRAAARVKQVGKTLGEKGVDLTDDLADIYARLAAMEKKAA
jgi:hypothetical protein